MDLTFFKFEHLPKKLRDVSETFHEVARTMIDYLPDNEETQMGLRKLLEAKDCFVRSAILKKE